MRHGCCLPPDKFLPRTPDGGMMTAYQALRYSQKVFLDMGYDYLESHMEPIMSLSEEELVQAKVDGLTVNSFNCFYPSSIRILDLSAEVFDRAEQALRRASLLGGRCIVFGSGPARSIPEGMTVEEGMKRIETFLTELDALCNKHNMIVAIEPLCQNTTIINSVGEVVDILERIKPHNIFALADVYHMYVVNEDISILKRAANFLRHIHISEPVDRMYPGSKKGEYLLAFADMLHKIGYNGDVTAECEFDDFNREAPLGAQFMKEYF